MSRRALLLIAIVVAAWRADAGEIPRAARARQIVADLLADGLRNRFEFWEELRVKGRAAAAPLGKDARPALLEVVKAAGTGLAERFVALAVLTELDAEGTLAGELLALLEAGHFAFDIQKDNRCEMALAHLHDYLARHLRAPKDLDRLCAALAADQTQLLVFTGRASSLMPAAAEARLFPALLPRLGGAAPHLLGGAMTHADYYVGGEAMRKTFLAIARDPAWPPRTRLEAARAWACRATRADYERVRGLLRSVEPWVACPANWMLRLLYDALREPSAVPKGWRRYPSAEVLETLAMLDWARAQREFAGAFAVIEKEMEEARRRHKQQLRTWNERRGAVPAPHNDLFGKRLGGWVVVPPPPPPPKPFPDRYYDALDLLATEEQVRGVLGALVEHFTRHGGFRDNCREEYRFVASGFRPAAPLFRSRRGPSSQPVLKQWFRLGLDVAERLKAILKDGSPNDVLRCVVLMENLQTMPPRLLDAHRRELVAVAEKVLDARLGRPGGTDLENLLAYNAFVALCRLAPEKAEPHISRYALHRPDQAAHCLTSPKARREVVKALEAGLRRHAEHDKWQLSSLARALAVVRGDAAVPLVRKVCRDTPHPGKRFLLVSALRRHAPAFAAPELAHLLKAERHPKRRLDIAKRLASTPVALDAEQARLAVTELRSAMRHRAGAPRLELAARLALLGDREGTAVLDSFLRGQWRPRTNFHGLFYTLAYCLLRRPGPAAGRARQFLARAVAAHPDPNVRAGAIRACGSYLAARGAGGKGYFLVDLLIGRLGPACDWRERAAAGLALRSAFRHVLPAWDYDPFAPPQAQRRAAHALARWWAERRARVHWKALDPVISASGYFALKP